jgi:hypothetical protein
MFVSCHFVPLESNFLQCVHLQKLVGKQTLQSTMLFPPVAKEDLAEKLLNWR